MSNARFLPITPMDPLAKWVDNMFNSTLAQVMGADLTVSSPSVNVLEHEDRFEMHLAAPGLDKSDFQLHLENGALVVSAERKNETEETTGQYTRKEFNYSSFKRTFRLDEGIDTERISAAYENGVLKVLLPKKEEVWKKASPTTIEIK